MNETAIAALESTNPLYPPAPWRLQGWGVATVQFVDLAAARRFVPADCAVVAVAPGRTLGGLLFVSYAFGSTLVYRELSIVAALVRAGGRRAFYLPRLYVDSLASLAGGRNIWGVPKEIASFDVTASGTRRTIVVRSNGSMVCRLQISRARAKVRLAVPLPALGTREGCLLFFTGRLSARFGRVHAAIDVPPSGEFGALSLGRPLLCLSLEDFDFQVPAPTIVLRNRE